MADGRICDDGRKNIECWAIEFMRPGVFRVPLFMLTWSLSLSNIGEAVRPNYYIEVCQKKSM